MKVIKAGISPKKIVFSGVGKTAKEIKYAIDKKIDIIINGTIPLKDNYFKLLTFFVSLDFKWAALFLCIILFLESLSIIETASGNFFTAAAFLVSCSNFFITVLVDLC